MAAPPGGRTVLPDSCFGQDPASLNEELLWRNENSEDLQTVPLLRVIIIVVHTFQCFKQRGYTRYMFQMK